MRKKEKRYEMEDYALDKTTIHSHYFFQQQYPYYGKTNVHRGEN
jgi:hypothetical protein